MVAVPIDVAAYPDRVSKRNYVRNTGVPPVWVARNWESTYF
jgi:hypothetical protein